MAMKRSGSSSRKPPELADDRGVIDEWLQEVRPSLQPITNRVDKLIEAGLSTARYAIKWNKAYYGRPEGGPVIEMVAYNKSVNVVFLGGADFDTPPPLGEGDRSRYVKLEDVDEIDDAELRAWIENATTVDGWT